MKEAGLECHCDRKGSELAESHQRHYLEKFATKQTGRRLSMVSIPTKETAGSRLSAAEQAGRSSSKWTIPASEETTWTCLATKQTRRSGLGPFKKTTSG